MTGSSQGFNNVSNKKQEFGMASCNSLENTNLNHIMKSSSKLNRGYSGTSASLTNLNNFLYGNKKPE